MVLFVYLEMVRDRPSKVDFRPSKVTYRKENGDGLLMMMMTMTKVDCEC